MKIVGVTPVGKSEADGVSVAGFFEAAGGTFPWKGGLEKATQEAWDAKGFPNVRIVKDGKIVGDTIEELEALLG